MNRRFGTIIALLSLIFCLNNICYAKFCSSCGTKANDEAIYCEKCGNKFGLSSKTVKKETGNKILLRHDIKVGTINKYEMNSIAHSITKQGNKKTETDIESSQVIEITTTDKDTDGVITQETKLLEGYTKTNGKKQKIKIDGSSIISKINNLGKTIFTTGDGENGNLNFPEEAVGIGDTWTIKMTPNSQMPIPLEMTYTVESIEKYKNEECVKISVISKGKSNTNNAYLTMELEGIIWFAYKKCYIINNELKYSSISGGIVIIGVKS